MFNITTAKLAHVRESPIHILMVELESMQDYVGLHTIEWNMFLVWKTSNGS